MTFHDNYYEADEDKTFIVKDTNDVMGYAIYLSSDDSIDNYEEVELTEENDIEHRKFNKEDEGSSEE